MCSTGFDFTRVCMCACTSYCRLRLAYVHRRWGGGSACRMGMGDCGRGMFNRCLSHLLCLRCEKVEPSVVN